MFHRNVQNGKVEFVNKPQNGLETIWKTLTQGAINSIMVILSTGNMFKLVMVKFIVHCFNPLQVLVS